MDESQQPPDQEYFLPAPKEVPPGDYVNERPLAHVVVVDECEGEDEQAGRHHVVEGLVVSDLKLEGKQGLAEPEHFLGALLADVVMVLAPVLLALVDVLGYLAPEVDQGARDLSVELALGLQDLRADVHNINLTMISLLTSRCHGCTFRVFDRQSVLVLLWFLLAQGLKRLHTAGGAGLVVLGVNLGQSVLLSLGDAGRQSQVFVLELPKLLVWDGGLLRHYSRQKPSVFQVNVL